MNPLHALMDLSKGPGKRLLAATIGMGFSEPIARSGLETEFAAWSEPGALEAVLDELEGVPSEQIPQRVLVIAASTLPASLLRQVLFARLLGAEVLVKTATGQEVLADILAEADSGVVPRPFRSDAVQALRSAIDAVDTVVVLGSDETIHSVEGHMPFHKTLVKYGHRVSAAWLSEPKDASIALMARDLCRWDQSGCMSPQVLWTEGDPIEVAASLSSQMNALEHQWPMTIPPEAYRARRVVSTIGHMSGRTFETESSLIVALDDPTFRPSPGYRVLWVLPADCEALEQCTVPWARFGTDKPEAFTGIQNRCELGKMQCPPLAFNAHGERSLTPLFKSG